MGELQTRDGGYATAVPEIAFERSEPLTLGIEEEFVLVDAADGVTAAARASEVLDDDWNTIPSPGGWFKAELLRCGIELTTAASRELLQLDVDLNALRDELVARASAHGMHAVGIGMHPDLHVTDDLVTPTDSHRAIAELHQRVGTLAEQVTNGIHVHVGMPSLDDAVRVMDALAAHVPLFLAVAANSPVVRGRRAPWRSARSEILRRMFWAGPTPRFRDADEYRQVHALHQLENSADQRFLWEVAPVPALGTVEVRSFDSQPNANFTLGLAALVQAIAAFVLDGGTIARPNESLERHNRWSAMEFATRARFLVVGRDEPVDATELLRDAIELARPYAKELGSESWLGIFDAVIDPPPVDAAIDAFDRGGLPGLMQHARLRASEHPDGA